jgi:pheromone shutdown-related protein TraB
MTEINNNSYSSKEDSKDLHPITIGDKHILLIGTAHISKQSVDLVRQVIEKEKPDTVCLELDTKRYEAMTQKKRWESLNLREVIKKKQLTTLLVQILLSNYQKKLSEQTGVAPGSEMLEADKIAKEHNIHIELSDREAGITLKRSWRKTPWYKKFLLLGNLVGSLFDRTKVDEEQLAEMRQTDLMTETMQELGKALPTVKQVLIDERDVYLAEKIKKAPGKNIVAVVGAGHVKGILEHMKVDNSHQIEEIESLPPASPWGKIIGWGIPAIIVGFLVATAATSLESAKDSLLFWVLINGSLSALGALIALGHPLTVLSAFVAAPVTSLTPVIGAGYVVAFVQAVLAPPLVKDIQSIGDDFHKIRRWWSNKALRVFLIFILSGVGSAAGTYIGGFEVVNSFFESVK